MPQVADELSNVFGHPVIYISRSLEEGRVALLASGLTLFVADLMVGLEQMFRDSVLSETTSTVQTLTGEPQYRCRNSLLKISKPSGNSLDAPCTAMCRLARRGRD
jgi:hypothetical protein